MSRAFVARGGIWRIAPRAALLAVLLGASLAAPEVGASVALAPGASGVIISGSTAAGEPDLKGLVLHDTLIGFEIRGDGGVLLYRGKLQNRVVRSEVGGRLHFYYRIRDTSPGLPGRVGKLVTGGFAGRDVRVDFRPDGLGTVGPATAGRNISPGALVMFEFAPPGLPPGAESRFIFVKTDARRFRSGGETKIELLAAPAGAAAPGFPAGRVIVSTVQPAP